MSDKVYVRLERHPTWLIDDLRARGAHVTRYTRWVQVEGMEAEELAALGHTVVALTTVRQVEAISIECLHSIAGSDHERRSLSFSRDDGGWSKQGAAPPWEDAEVIASLRGKDFCADDAWDIIDSYVGERVSGDGEVLPPYDERHAPADTLPFLVQYEHLAEVPEWGGWLATDNVPVPRAWYPALFLPERDVDLHRSIDGEIVARMQRSDGATLLVSRAVDHVSLLSFDGGKVAQTKRFARHPLGIVEVIDGRLLIAGARELVCADADGAVLWKTKLAAPVTHIERERERDRERDRDRDREREREREREAGGALLVEHKRGRERVGFADGALLTPPPIAARRAPRKLDDAAVLAAPWEERAGTGTLRVAGRELSWRVGDRTWVWDVGWVTAIGPRVLSGRFVQRVHDGRPVWALFVAPQPTDDVPPHRSRTLTAPPVFHVVPPRPRPLSAREYEGRLSEDQLYELRGFIESGRAGFVDDDDLLHVLQLEGDFAVLRYESLIETALSLLAKRGGAAAEQGFQRAIERGVPARSFVRACALQPAAFALVLPGLGRREQEAGRLKELHHMLPPEPARALAAQFGLASSARAKPPSSPSPPSPPPSTRREEADAPYVAPKQPSYRRDDLDGPPAVLHLPIAEGDLTKAQLQELMTKVPFSASPEQVSSLLPLLNVQSKAADARDALVKRVIKSISSVQTDDVADALERALRKDTSAVKRSVVPYLYLHSRLVNEVVPALLQDAAFVEREPDVVDEICEEFLAAWLSRPPAWMAHAAASVRRRFRR